jgi:hypothetical protein
METAISTEQQPERGPGGIPVPVQKPVRERPVFPEAPAKEKNLLGPAVKDGEAWYLQLKAEIDLKLSGPMILKWLDGRVISKNSEPVLYDLPAVIRKAERELADHQAGLANRKAALATAEKEKRFSLIESISARIRELENLVANAAAVLDNLKIARGPQQLAQSIDEKKKFADMLRDELSRIDAEVDAAQELHTSMTQKPAAAKSGK